MVVLRKMKKTTIYRTLVVIDYLILGLVLLLMWQIGKPLSLKSGWFAVLIAAVSVGLYIKFFVFKSDNILWFAMYLMLVAVFNAVVSVGVVQTSLWPTYVCFGFVVSFILSIIYKSLWQACLAIMLFFIGAPLYLISLNLVSAWVFAIIYVASTGVGVAICNFVLDCVRSNYG